MSRLLIHVEGQTEETFINEVLAPHLHQYGFSTVSARLLGNSRCRFRRGGVGHWQSARTDILNHLKEDTGSISTIMVDYYALPNSWPMKPESIHLPFPAEKANLIQDEIHADICAEMGNNFLPSRFIPYIMMYEFEGLLFSSPDAFARGIAHSELSADFHRIKANFETPEHINDSPQTAPSKRIINLVKNYDKPHMGVLAILEIGLTEIRTECPLFNYWLTQLENHRC
ncbi:MAG: hypothetical protein COA95_05775 [Methylophaga sp.]|nr:MAG: hypothetical protein COA95_05775 [Methylophaga sp.]